MTRQNISADGTLPRPSTAKLQALQWARRTPVVNVLRAQDHCVTLGRRVILTQSLRGCAAWLIPDSSPETGTRTHPDNSTERVTSRGLIELTPGHGLRISVLCVPGGRTQTTVLSGGNYHDDGGLGALVLRVTWTDSTGASVATDHTVDLPVSELDDGASTTAGDGTQWSRLRLLELGTLLPEPFTTSDVVRRWSLRTTVTLSLACVGGARIVDACVSEAPAWIGYDAGDDWCAHLYGSGKPENAGPVISYPLTELGAADPRGGTHHMIDVATNQTERLGPQLISWGAYDEDDYGVTSSEITAISYTTTGFQGFPNSSQSSWNASQQGWSLSCGAYARSYKHNHPRAVGYDGVVPVRVRVYCRGADSGGTTSAGVFRLQSAADSYVDVSIPSGTTWAWRTAYGYLRCGQGPGDLAVAQAFARRTGGSGGVSVRALQVYVSGPPVTAL